MKKPDNKLTWLTWPDTHNFCGKKFIKVHNKIFYEYIIKRMNTINKDGENFVEHTAYLIGSVEPRNGLIFQYHCR